MPSHDKTMEKRIREAAVRSLKNGYLDMSASELESEKVLSALSDVSKGKSQKIKIISTNGNYRLIQGLYKKDLTADVSIEIKPDIDFTLVEKDSGISLTMRSSYE